MNPVDARYILEEIEPHLEKLTRWERGFIKNIRTRWVDRGRFLEGDQPKTLQRICSKLKGMSDVQI